MQDPISTLIYLNELTQECDIAQVLIDRARASLPTDQYLQFRLDRKQTEVDNKRKLIEILKLDIASRN